MDNRPIGVFDSGLGGLTGVRELRKRLPHEDIIYFGDTGRVPYGSRSPETILQYARQDVAFLLSKNVKCIMAACGTVSSTYPAAEAARCRCPIWAWWMPPPGRQPLPPATAASVSSARRPPSAPAAMKAAAAAGAGWRSLPAPARCSYRWWRPGMWITAKRKQQVTKLVIAQYLTEVREAGVDTLILGCTHYPLLKTMIGEFMGRRDAGGSGHDRRPPSGADAVRARPARRTGRTRQAHFYVSDVPDSFVQTADLFLGEYKGGPVEQLPLINIDKEYNVSKPLKEDYIIRIKSRIEQRLDEPVEEEEKEEFVELMTRGQFVQKGGSYYITYKETETTGYEGCTTTLKIAADGSRVAMLRFGKGGGAGTQLLIEKGRATCATTRPASAP